jgi:hypothetical protein
MSTLNTVLISASTSASVALVIEWAAKPGLEARKERILERYRMQRDIARQLKVISMNVGTLQSDIQASDDLHQQIVLRFQQERRVAIIEAGQKIGETVVDVGPYMNAHVRALVSNVAGRAQAINPSDVDYKPPEIMRIVAGFCLDLYSTPRWRVRSRRKMINTAIQLMKALASDSESEPEPSDP